MSLYNTLKNFDKKKLTKLQKKYIRVGVLASFLAMILIFRDVINPGGIFNDIVRWIRSTFQVILNSFSNFVNNQIRYLARNFLQKPNIDGILLDGIDEISIIIFSLITFLITLRVWDRVSLTFFVGGTSSMILLLEAIPNSFIQLNRGSEGFTNLSGELTSLYSVISLGVTEISERISFLFTTNEGHILILVFLIYTIILTALIYHQIYIVRNPENYKYLIPYIIGFWIVTLLMFFMGEGILAIMVIFDMGGYQILKYFYSILFVLMLGHILYYKLLEKSSHKNILKRVLVISLILYTLLWTTDFLYFTRRQSEIIGILIGSIGMILVLITTIYLIHKRNHLPWSKGNYELTLFTAIALTSIAIMGFWDEMLETFVLIIMATMASITVGIPLGIMASKSEIAWAILRPILDFMQTLPPFVYLIPTVFFFGIGVVPGLISTFVFSVPPAIRLTNLGIRQVPKELDEVSEAYGTTFMQKLIKVEIPVAFPNIMAGVNQVIMLALSMVVIAALIGAQGLGGPVVRSLSTLNLPLGFESGLAIVFVAIILDRVTASFINDD
jgi:glycine betaine/proline transport system permease protein